MPDRIETRLDVDPNSVTFGLDEGSFSASISSSGILSLGIGVAEVELNLKNPNDSAISFGFGLFAIEGHQEGCQVILTYSIAGQVTHTETRIVPDCDPGKPPLPDPPKPRPGEPPQPPKIPNPYGQFRALVFIKRFMSAVGAINSYYSPTWIYYKDEGTENTVSGAEISKIENRWDYRYEAKYSSHNNSYWFNGITGEADWDQSSENLRATEQKASVPFGYKPADSSFQNIFYYGVEAIKRRQLTALAETGWVINQLISDHLISTGESQPALFPSIGGADPKNYSSGIVSRAVEWGVVYVEANPHSSPPIDAPVHPKLGKKMDCDCKKIVELLEEIHGALNVDELINNGFTIPNRMVVPNATGKTKLENYLDIMQWQMRQADHLGIHPFIATIKDSNEAIAGDQSLSLQFPNATAVAKYIAETVMEGKGDAAVRLSLLVRLSYATAQMTTILVQASRGIKALSSYFGMPIVERIESVKIPFDILLGIRPKENKGFGKETSKSGEQIKAELLKKIDQNSEDATEDMLPDFMKVAELEIKTQDFRPSTDFDFWAFLKRVMRVD